MGTRRSKHNKGRKPLYKDHRSVAAHLLAHPRYAGFGGFGSTTQNGWHNTRTWWTEPDKFALAILAEADADIEGAADALGRSTTSIAHRARDFGLVLPTQWSRLIRPKYTPRHRQPKEAVRLYPYIVKARDEHADLLAVNAIIPKGIPDNMRADMCQEVMIAILEGRTTLEMLKAKNGNASYYIKKFYHDNYEAGGHAISFNDVDEDWDSDAVASSLATKEWHREQFADHTSHVGSLKTFTPPAQFEAAWQDQIGRTTIKFHELGQFLTHEEVEEMLNAESELRAD